MSPPGGGRSWRVQRAERTATTCSADKSDRPQRWHTAVVGLGAVFFLVSGLVRVDGPAMTGPAWVRLVVFVLLVAATATFSILASRAALPPDDTNADGRRGATGLGVDGPEYRRVRRALREGSALREEERERALARARRRLAHRSDASLSAMWAAPHRRWSTLLAVSYASMVWLWFPPSFAAPSVGRLGVFVVAVLLIWGAVQLERTGQLPGARRRQARARARVAALENLPTRPRPARRPAGTTTPSTPTDPASSITSTR